MKKSCLFLLLFLICIGIFATSVSAETTRSDLSDIYESLTEHVYAPFFENSSRYDPFLAQLNRLGELLKRQNIAQEDINTAYRNMKNAYVDLMMDTFDYSELNEVLAFYNSLDLSLFTEESRDRLISSSEAVQKELASPSLFRTGNVITVEEYHEVAQEHIADVANKFDAAFRQLAIDETIESPTVSHLDTLLKMFTATAQETLVGQAESFAAFREAKQSAEALLTQRAPRQAALDAAFRDLIKTYDALIHEALDLSPIQDEIIRFSALYFGDYSEKSWNRYADSIAILRERVDAPFYFYFSSKDTVESMKEQVKAFLASFNEPVDAAYKTLVPMKTYQELFDLCARYRSTTCTEGLEIKLNRLLTSVKAGDAILASDEATPPAFQSAIEAIRSSVEDLELAERFLAEEQAQEIHHDEKTVRRVVISTLIVLALSLACACFYSVRYFEKVNWRK